MLHQRPTKVFTPQGAPSYAPVEDVELKETSAFDTRLHAPPKEKGVKFCDRWAAVWKKLWSPVDKASDAGDENTFDDPCPSNLWHLPAYLVAGPRYHACHRRTVVGLKAFVVFFLAYLLVTYLWRSYYCSECYTCLAQAREVNNECAHTMITSAGRLMVCFPSDNSVWLEPRIVHVDPDMVIETEEVFPTAAKCPTKHYFGIRYPKILVSGFDAIWGTYRERVPFTDYDAICLQHKLYERVLGHGCRPTATFLVDESNKPRGFAIAGLPVIR